MADFRQIEHEWTTWLRQPDQALPPAGVEPLRMMLYRELLFNNVSSFVENAFPVVQQWLAPAHWQKLVADFFALHRCQSPFFYDIAKEFFDFVLTRDQEQALYPWLVELAHFEWAELAADMAEATLPDYQAGDVLAGVPVLNPCVWPLIYHWPVHTFAVVAPPAQPLERPVCVLLYRNLADQAGFIEISVLTAHWLERIQQQQNSSGAEVLAMIAGEQGLDAVAAKAEAVDMVQTLMALDIILGVRC